MEAAYACFSIARTLSQASQLMMAGLLIFGPTKMCSNTFFQSFQNKNWKRYLNVVFYISGETKSLMITENKAIHVGEPLELSCSTAGLESASLRIKNVSSGQLVANSYGSVDRLRVFILKNDDHQLAVRINLTQLSDGGMYECVDPLTGSQSAVSTRVVVLG